MATPPAGTNPQETAPKRKPAAPKIPLKRLAELLLLPVGVANTFAFLALPPTARDDLLTEAEQLALAEALAGVVALHPGALRVLAGAAASTPYLALVLCVSNLALVRLVRHGVLPGTVLGVLAGMKAASDEADSPGPVAAGPARGDNRGYGEREIDARRGATPFATIRGGAADKAR